MFLYCQVWVIRFSSSFWKQFPFETFCQLCIWMLFVHDGIKNRLFDMNKCIVFVFMILGVLAYCARFNFIYLQSAIKVPSSCNFVLFISNNFTPLLCVCVINRFVWFGHLVIPGIIIWLLTLQTYLHHQVLPSVSMNTNSTNLLPIQFCN